MHAFEYISIEYNGKMHKAENTKVHIHPKAVYY